MPFFKIFKSKTFTNKQILSLGLVLATLSMISLAISVVLFPMFGLWMNANGVRQLDFFFMAFMFVFLCSTQALVLFGFPIYYAQDQKSHMTAFRILLSTLMWMVVLMFFFGFVFVQIEKPAPISIQDFDASNLDTGAWAEDSGVAAPSEIETAPQQ